MLAVFLSMKVAIQAVQATQTYNKSLKCLNLTDKDQEILEEIKKFFEIFKEAIVSSQANEYPTLHRTVLFYVLLLKKLKAFSTNTLHSTIQQATNTAYTYLEKYFKDTMTSRAPCVAAAIDPRFKLEVFQWLDKLHGLSARTNQSLYNKAKAHFTTVYGRYRDRANDVKGYKEAEAEEQETDETPRAKKPLENNPFASF